jgi:hypothetical protein
MMQRKDESPGRREVLGAISVGGALLFVALTGLMIWLLPFGVTAQMAVLFHTLAGLLLIITFAFWQFRHWGATRKRPRSASKMSAYIAFWLLAANFISGALVTYQAGLETLSSHFWSAVHLWTGILALPFMAFHVLPRRIPGDGDVGQVPLVRRPHEWTARRPVWMWSSGTAMLLLAVLLVAAASYHSTAFSSYQPPSSFHAGPGPNPFAPSNARTENSRPLPPEIISDSSSCGASGCHATIYQEWRASAHRWSEEDQFFQAVRTATTEVQGLKATEKCGGCHAPVSMLSGYKDPRLGTATSGYQEGDSCIICHAVRQVDERGIGSYVLGIPKAYLYQYNRTRFAAFINHFLIRVYPEQHDRDYDLKIARDAQSCAPCHKEFDVVGKYPGLLEVETQYDDWKHHKWNTDRDTTRRLRCQQCHMYFERAATRDLADPYDLAVGLGLGYRNHRFAAANQFMPSALNSPGANEQTRDANEWLTGKREVPEIQKVWPRGAVVPMKIEAASSVEPGGILDLQVVLTNSKAGHSFPTGPLNVVRVWVELAVQDNAGKKVFHSGELDRESHVEAGTYVIRPIAITEDGHSMMTEDIWHPQGPQFRPAINPGESESFEYRFQVPQDVAGPLKVQARLRYRKANQFFMDEVYSPDHRTAPVTDISSASVNIPVAGRHSVFSKN